MAITGSAGKTTTKEVTAELLAARYRVVRNRGNLNNHIGLPLSLVELRQRPEIAVVELGMNHPGEISTLVRVAEPDVRVWTNVGEAHLGFFASVDAIADAKAEIFEAASPDTVLVANADDDRIVARLPSFAGRVRHASGSIATRTCVPLRSSIAASTAPAPASRPPRGTVEMTTPLVGRGNLANVLAATAVADRVRRPARDDRGAGRDPSAGGAPRRDRAASKRHHDHRRQLQRQPDRDETRARRADRQRVGVAGESPCSAKCSSWAIAPSDLHAAVGRAAAAAKVDVLLAVGGAPAAALAEAAVAAGLSKDAVQHFATSDEAAEAAVGDRTKAGDLVLVKGSRGVRTDRRGRSAESGAGLMLFYLLYPFHTQFSVLNVTRYITFRTAAASLSALAISLVLGPWMVRKLREFQIGQVIRQEGPQTHRAKSGTPTMGGLLILTAALVPTLLWADLTNVYVWIAVLTTAAFGAIGFADDYLKIVRPIAPRAAAALQARSSRC